MRALIAGACATVLPLALVGCGGGGGGSDSPSPAPGPPTPPTPPPTPPPPSEIDVNILSYNLQWHRTHGTGVPATINAIGSFDLMGFQECDDINSFVKDVQGTYDVKQGPQDIAMAWNTKVFKKVAEGMGVAGKDGWGERDMHWVRLNVVGTDHHVLFANTHGPVNQCSGAYEDWKNVAHNYINIVEKAMKEGDKLFFTGDWNCGATPLAANNPQKHGLDMLVTELRTKFHDIAAASFFYPILFQPDRVYTLKNSTTTVVDYHAVCCSQPGTCENVVMNNDDCDDPSNPKCVAAPSDHMALKVHVKMPLTASPSKVIV